MKKVSQVRRTIIIMHMYMTEHVSHSFSGSPEDLIASFTSIYTICKSYKNLFKFVQYQVVIIFFNIYCFCRF